METGSRLAMNAELDPGRTYEAPVSAVSWPAVFGGAFVAAAVTLILVALGSGFGLATVSPWSNSGASATTFSIMTGIWLIVVQWLASGTGGYLTGRLRTKWVGTHTHEVFFRDTAHGFLAWSLASVMGALLVGALATSAVGTGVRAASTVAGGAAQGAVSSMRAYDVDSLFRPAHPDAAATPQEVRGEATRILAKGITTGDVSSGDRDYLTQLVVTHTGMAPADAQQRVDGVIAGEKQAEQTTRQAADTARKAASALSIFTGLSMLIGAFIACVAAALGGKRRDEHV